MTRLVPRRIAPEVVDVALAAVVLIASAVGIIVWRFGLGVDISPGATALAVAGALGTSIPLLWRRSRPVVVFAVVSVAFLLYRPLSSPVQPLGVLAAVYALGAYAPRRASALAIGIGSVVGGSILVALSAFTATSLGDVGSFGIVVFGVWAIGYAVGTRRAYVQSLEERARLLEVQREENARHAVAEERSRIARELHDVVAHHVMMMVVQAGGARRVLDKQPEKSRDALDTIEQTGRNALAELRRLLGVMRDPERRDTPEPQPGVEQIPSLVARTRDAGLRVGLEVEGEERTLAPGASLTVYRIVQEALTNVVKHGNGAPARVLLRYTPGAVEIEVIDEGPGSPHSDGVGHGLVGMRERVAVFGGDFEAGTRPDGGFRVLARIPSEDTP